MSLVLTAPHAISKFSTRLFASSSEPAGVLSTLGWWESRRCFYNAALAFAALPGLFVYLSHGGANVLILAAAVFVWGFPANICYSMGSVVEVVARQMRPQINSSFAPALFKLGLIFSVGLTGAESLITTIPPLF